MGQWMTPLNYASQQLVVNKAEYCATSIYIFKKKNSDTDHIEPESFMVQYRDSHVRTTKIGLVYGLFSLLSPRLSLM